MKMKIQNTPYLSVKVLEKSKRLSYLKQRYLTQKPLISDMQYDIERLKYSALCEQEGLYEYTYEGLLECMNYLDKAKYILEPYVSGLDVRIEYEKGVIKAVYDMTDTDILTEKLKAKLESLNLAKVSLKVESITGVLYAGLTFSSTFDYNMLTQFIMNEQYELMNFVGLKLSLKNKVLSAEQEVTTLKEMGIPSLPYKVVYKDKVRTVEDIENLFSNFNTEEDMDIKSFVLKATDTLIIYKDITPLMYENAITEIEWRKVNKEETNENIFVPYAKLVKQSTTSIGTLDEICLEDMRTILVYDLAEGKPIYFYVGEQPYVCNKAGRFLAI